MCESHTCRSKIVTSRIQNNFSHLTDNSECNSFLTFEKLSEHLRNSLIMLEIDWKSLGNCCPPCFEVIENLSTPLVIVGSCLKIIGSRWKPSKALRRSFEIFGNLRKPSLNLRKFRFCRDEKSHAFY